MIHGRDGIFRARVGRSQQILNQENKAALENKHAEEVSLVEKSGGSR
jgi:hypothetical protein